MGFFDFFKPADPIQKAAKQWARMLVSWQKKNPGLPISQAISPQVAALLRSMSPEGTHVATIDAILSGGQIGDVHEFCRSLVQLQTGVEPGSEQYARVVRAVDQELAAARAAV